MVFEHPGVNFISDLVLGLEESSQAVCSSLKGDDIGSELPVVLVDEPAADMVSLMYCEPLAMVAPFGPTEGVSGFTSEPSVWVKQWHRGFYKLVGFPIKSHEQECLALLQRIEAYQFATKAKGGFCCPSASGSKSSRELRRLVSSVNYDRCQFVCRGVAGVWLLFGVVVGYSVFYAATNFILEC